MAGAAYTISLFLIKREMAVERSANTPYKVEMALRKFIPEEDVAHSHFWLLLHGRYTCTALRPKCEQCGLSHLCKGPIKAKAK